MWTVASPVRRCGALTGFEHAAIPRQPAPRDGHPRDRRRLWPCLRYYCLDPCAALRPQRVRADPALDCQGEIDRKTTSQPGRHRLWLERGEIIATMRSSTA